MENSKYLDLLAEQYKDSVSVISEMVNLQAIVNLPKGTEHYLSDIHGEFDAFNHILKNASGAIKMYIEGIFGLSLSAKEKEGLALMIYYPKERLEVLECQLDNKEEFYKITLFRLVKVLKRASRKYTRSKVRKALPKEFAYILEELIHEDIDDDNKQMYYTNIISSIVELGSQHDYIIAISNAIQRLVIDHLHIIGDVFDRGLYPDKVMDLLMEHHSLDIQWGNHDISWIGANAGSESLICNVIRLCAKHNNLELLEDSYGINLVSLVRYSMEMFKDDECEIFMPTNNLSFNTKEKELILASKIHKAITILQFKVEAELIKRRPEYKMENRLLLHKIDFEKGSILIDNKEYDLLDKKFQTINKDNPYFITEEERDILNKLKYSFINSPKLTKHIKLFMDKGAMYSVFNNNLLFHGCVPINENKEFRECEFLGEKLSGKKLIDKIDDCVRDGYYETKDTFLKQKNIDLMWYLWCGEHSPLFGKNKMACFEQYYVEDKELKKETKDFYYSFRDEKEVAEKVLHEFGLFNNEAKIINGHVPVEVKKGESPIKAEGKLIVIDGGLTKAYHKITGISGYTLISNSVGIYLAEHEPFTSTKDIIENGFEIISNNSIIERYQERVLVKDTDNGKLILQRIEELKYLLNAYNKGFINKSK